MHFYTLNPISLPKAATNAPKVQNMVRIFVQIGVIFYINTE